MAFGFLKRIVKRVVEPVERFVKRLVAPVARLAPSVEPIAAWLVAPAVWLAAPVAWLAAPIAWLVAPVVPFFRRVFGGKDAPYEPINDEEKKLDGNDSPGAPRSPSPLEDFTCRTPGCGIPGPFVLSNGVASEYCGDAHKELGTSGCIVCRRATAKDIGNFCQACHEGVLYQAPMLVPVPDDHDLYESVKSQFQKAWLGNERGPDVHAIYEVVRTRENDTKYKQYLDRVEAAGNFSAGGQQRGNEQNRWIGPLRSCPLGNQGKTDFCPNTLCELCYIIELNLGNMRITATVSSSRAHLHSNNETIPGWKALLLSKVVVGRECRANPDGSTLTELPDTYDSVMRAVGGDNEVVVYDRHAFLPLYLVMYDVPIRELPDINHSR